MRLRFFALAIGATCAAIAACSLGLDEGLLDRPDAAPEVDTGAPDTGVDAPPPLRDGGACTRDDECTTTHGCLKGRCDLARGACAYDVCKPMACTSGACDLAKQECTQPKPYRYRAGSFTIGAPLSCTRCVAAVHPWLVVLTANGPLAFNVSDPQGGAAVPVPVTGVGFVPSVIVQSGSRVYFVMPSQGAGASTRLPLAYIDMPADPFVTKLEAKTVLAVYNRPPGESPTVLAREGDSVILIGPGGAQSFPSAIVQPPLTEPVTITMSPLSGFTAGTTPVAVSGSRLVMRQINPTSGIATFGFIADAGSPMPAAQQDTALTDAGPFGGGESFAQTPAGSVFWAVNNLTAAPSPGPASARAVRGYFLVADRTATFDPSASVDIEVFGGAGAPPPGGAALAGPSAMVDPKSAIVVAAAREGVAAQTSIQFVRRDPLELVKDMDGGLPKRTVLPIPIGSIVGAAASNGVGYVVANEPASNATVYVFDPACSP